MIQHLSTGKLILKNGIVEDDSVVNGVNFEDLSSLINNPVTVYMKVVGWTVAVMYCHADDHYDISINGVWFKDMQVATPEPRELSRIYRITQSTSKHENSLTTFF